MGNIYHFWIFELKSWRECFYVDLVLFRLKFGVQRKESLEDI